MDFSNEESRPIKSVDIGSQCIIFLWYWLLLFLLEFISGECECFSFDSKPTRRIFVKLPMLVNNVSGEEQTKLSWEDDETFLSEK